MSKNASRGKFLILGLMVLIAVITVLGVLRVFE